MLFHVSNAVLVLPLVSLNESVGTELNTTANQISLQLLTKKALLMKRKMSFDL